jgi:hypothetical protein
VTLSFLRFSRRIGFAVFAAVAMSMATSVHAQPRCGAERWPVKTGGDDDVTAVDTIPVPATIAELVQIPRPAATFHNARRVGPYELQTFVVRARVARVTAEDDSDIHLFLRDLELPNVTLVAEIPSGACTSNAQLGQRFEDARRALRGLPRDGLVEIIGIGFFDFLHGQSGTELNGFEIHPVLSLRVLMP